MFAVLFEILPRPDQFNAYLGYAKMLAPEVNRLDGFLGVVRYRSLTREGWILSLSSWQDEGAIVRWRMAPEHRDVQAKGRSEVFLDYRIRVGQLVRDLRAADIDASHKRGKDSLESTGASTVTLIDAKWTVERVEQSNPEDVAKWRGLDVNTKGYVSWDVFEAVLTPGDIILVISWSDETAANAFDAVVSLPNGARFRRVSVVRDYGMFDRREAPQ